MWELQSWRRSRSATELAVGIVGPGAIAAYHATAVRAAGARIVAVTGPVRAEAMQFAREHGVEEVDDSLDRLLNRRDIDVVLVTSPSGVHSEQTLRALQAGKHVLCEVPAATSLGDAERIAETAREIGRHVGVANTARYWPSVRRLTELIRAAEAPVRHVVGRSMFLRHGNIGWTGRRRTWTDSVLWHHAAHTVDLALLWLDESEPTVAGFCGPGIGGSIEPMDVAIALGGRSGIASLSLSYNSRVAVSDLLVVTEEQTLHLRDGRLEGADGSVHVSDDLRVQQIAAIAAQDREFLQAVVDGHRPPYTISDALPTLRVLDAVAAAGRASVGERAQ